MLSGDAKPASFRASELILGGALGGVEGSAH